MIMTFTIIQRTVDRLKTGVVLNSIIVFYQITYYLKKPFDSILQEIVGNIDKMDLENVVQKTDTLSQSFSKPIQGAASVMLLDNLKLYFLLIYIATIILFVVFLERMSSKKKGKLQKTTAGKETYYLDKFSIESGNGNEKFDCPNELHHDEKDLMSCEVKEEILKKLLVFEEGTKYTDKNFNLSALSVKLKINTKYLSYIINKYKKKDFNSYINELRIRYIIKKMESNPAYLNYKISYLADECGFSSHSKFTAVFKAVVGMSPSHFMDNLSKRQNK